MLLAVGSGGQAAFSAAAQSNGQGNKAQSDVKGHWAEKQLLEWEQKGWISGYGDGMLRPDQPVKRSEFAALVNRALGKSEGSATALSFKDVKKESWEYSTVATAVYAGYVKGYNDGTFRPAEKVSRQEAAVMIAKAAGIDSTAVTEPSFSDKASLPSWSKSYVAALASQGILGGYPDGSFRPNGQLTRAEAVTAIGKAVGSASKDMQYNKAGVYGPETGSQVIEGSVKVGTAEVTLKNLIIKGDLVLEEEIAEGDAFFNGIKVEGKTIIRGGGIHSIHFKDSQLSSVFLEKKGSPVRLSVEGSSVLESVTVSEDSTDSVVALDFGSRIDTLTLNGKTFVTGQGTVGEAIVGHKASDSVFEKEPGSKKLQPAPTMSPSPTPVAGGGGGFFPGFPGNPTSTPSPTPTPAVEAAITGISVGGYPLTAFFPKSDKLGFDPEVYEYDVVLPLNYVAGDMDITVTSNRPDVNVFVTVWDEYGDNLIKNVKLDANGKVRYPQQARQESEIYVSQFSQSGEFERGYSVRVLYEWTLAEKTKVFSSGELLVDGTGIKSGDTLRVYTTEQGAPPVKSVVQSSDDSNISVPEIDLIKLFASSKQTGTVWVTLQKNGLPEGERHKVAYDFRELTDLNGSVKARVLSKEELGDYATYAVKLEVDPQSPLPAGAVFARAIWYHSNPDQISQPVENAKVKASYSSRLTKLQGTRTEISDYFGYDRERDFKLYPVVYYYDTDKQPIGFDVLPVDVKVYVTPQLVERLIAELPAELTVNDYPKLELLQRLYGALSPEEQAKVSNYNVVQQGMETMKKLPAVEEQAKQLKSLSLTGTELNEPFNPKTKQYFSPSLFGTNQIEAVLDYDSNLSEVYAFVEGSEMDDFVPVQGNKFTATLGPQDHQNIVFKVKSKTTGQFEMYSVLIRKQLQVRLTPIGGTANALSKAITLHVYGSQNDELAYDIVAGNSYPGGPGMPGISFDAPFKFPINESKVGSIWISLEFKEVGVISKRIEYKYDFTPLQEVIAADAVSTTSLDLELALLQDWSYQAVFSYTAFRANPENLPAEVRYVSGVISTMQQAPTVQDARQQMGYFVASGKEILRSMSNSFVPKNQTGILYLYDAFYNSIGYINFDYQTVPSATPKMTVKLIEQLDLNAPQDQLKINIERARAAYELLSTEQKAQVTNYNLLVLAESQLLP
nr:S-layer homology domain-containing protein [Paenibacillus pasadenensis]